MNWDQYRTTMERYAIKTDDMAAEDAYFMATHMPFSQLEVLDGGSVSSTPRYLSEDEVFEQLIYNPQNAHRMVIVRGNNGTGKSHLIRYLKARFENSPSTVYNPNKEHLIFLRRLNNSVRGAFSQLLEEDVIQDQSVAAKMRKFVDSSVAKDEESFKTEILYHYIAAVSNDRSGKYYKPIDCNNMAQFLSDSRVKDLLLAQDGAISRCYHVINAPSTEVLQESTIFLPDDFLSRSAKKAIKQVSRNGNPDAQDFVQTIYNNEDEVVRFVSYLNRFAGEVIQRCADISSETAKSVFEQLRRDLKKQGKNLTLFIEDFTGFTGVDSELITVLSTEHGGDYDYLCRVTSVIGITNGYYDQFKDNFKDRVTHQINVTERSYGSSTFLNTLTARYLNAIYCAPEAIRNWHRNGAVPSDLPVSQFTPPCEWETVSVSNKELTLFPFNRSALRKLYNQLQVKTPRMFLKQVIRDQLKEYFDGKEYGDEWEFPLNPGFLQMKNAPHSSNIDRNESIPDDERQRIKNVLAIWGDGSASGVMSGGTLFIGGLNKQFFADIGLDFFNPIGKIEELDAPAENTEQNDIVSSPEEVNTNETQSPSNTPQPAQNVEPPKRISPAERHFNERDSDINNWFSANKTLQFDMDYRTWLKDFLIGQGRQCGAINWQDLGIPAFIAWKRLSQLHAFYIEGQSSNGRPEKAIVCLDRSPESKDVLLALNRRDYEKSWDFPTACYYQQKLVVWLERQKKQILANVCAADRYLEQLPVIEWCSTLAYYKNILFGNNMDVSTPVATISSLFQELNGCRYSSFATAEWKDVVSFVDSSQSEFHNAQELLCKASTTTMGSISGSESPSVLFYHTAELVSTIQKLDNCQWDIEQELPARTEENILYNPALLLKKLYPKLRAVAAAESSQYRTIRNQLEQILGELTRSNLLDTIGKINDLVSTLNQDGVGVPRKLSDPFEGRPIDVTNQLLNAISLLDGAEQDALAPQLAKFSQRKYRNPSGGSEKITALMLLTEMLHTFKEIERLAKDREKQARDTLRNLGIDTATEELLRSAAMDELQRLYEQIEHMEVRDAVE